MFTSTNMYGVYMVRVWYERKYCYTKISNTKSLRTKLMWITVHTLHCTYMYMCSITSLKIFSSLSPYNITYIVVTSFKLHVYLHFKVATVLSQCLSPALQLEPVSASSSSTSSTCSTKLWLVTCCTHIQYTCTYTCTQMYMYMYRGWFGMWEAYGFPPAEVDSPP